MLSHTELYVIAFKKGLLVVSVHCGPHVTSKANLWGAGREEHAFILNFGTNPPNYF